MPTSEPYDIDAEVGLRRVIAQALKAGPTKEAVDLIDGIVAGFRAEVTAAAEARKAVGDVMLSHGITLRVGSEAECLDAGIKSLKEDRPVPTVVIATHEGESEVEAVSGKVRITYLPDTTYYAENEETMTAGDFEGALEGKVMEGNDADVELALESSRADMEPYLSGPARRP